MWRDLLTAISKERVRGQLRHLLSSVGPLVAAHGITTDAYWQMWVGIVIASLAFVDSWITK